ncbi:ANKRD27 [Symbiodinium sp. CCMP2592]|nr:ANKRD27 [Symbiodinium sp. CCMP2592]
MVRWLGFLWIVVGAGIRAKNRVDWPWEEHPVSSSDEVQRLLATMLAETTAEATEEAGDVEAQHPMLREVVANIRENWRSTSASTCHQQLGKVMNNFSLACQGLRPNADWLLDYYVPVLPNKTCAESIGDIFALGDDLVETLRISRNAIASLDVDDRTLRRYQALSFLRNWLVNLTRTDDQALLWAGFWDGDPQNRATQAKLSNFARATEHSTMHPNTFLGQAIEASQDLDACYKQATTNTLAENMWSIASMSFVLGMRDKAQGTVIALVNKQITGERNLSESVLSTHEIPTVGLAAWGLGFWSPKVILLDLMGTCYKTSPILQKQLFARLRLWAKSMTNWSPAAFAKRSRLQWQCIDCSGACSLDEDLAEHVQQLVKAKDEQDRKDRELRQVASPLLAVAEEEGLNYWEELTAAHKLMGRLWNNPETRRKAQELKDFYLSLHMEDLADLRKAEHAVPKLHVQARLRRVEHLLHQNADPNAPDRHGNTALIGAAIEGHLELVEPLLKAGAQLEARNDLGTTAFIYAAANGHLAIIEALRKAGAEP